MPITPPPTITAVDELNYSLLHIWTNDEGRRTNAETRPARLRRSSLVLRHWRASSTARPLADDRCAASTIATAARPSAPGTVGGRLSSTSSTNACVWV